MRWLAAVAVAAIVGLLVLSLRERAPERAPPAEPGDPAPVPAIDRPVVAGSDDIIVSEALGGDGAPTDEGVSGSAPRPERRPDPPWDEREETATHAEAPIEIAGTLSVEGDAAPTGSFRLTWSWDQGWNRSTIDVRGGAWSAVVPVGSRLTFDEIRVGGRVAVAVDRKTVAPASGRVAVACRWFKPTTLRILDADTGAELAGVEIVQHVAGFCLSGLHPGPGYVQVVADDAASPVTLPEQPGQQVYWVRGPGHAWKRVEVMLGFGDERIVRLPKAGDLDVRLSNFDPDSDAEVRLYDVTGGHLLSWPSDTRPRIESLAPGKYRVRVEVGEWFREPLLLGEAPAEVEAGVVTEVAIELRDPPHPERLVPLAGTLHVDPGWGEEAWIHMSVDGEDVPPGTDDPDVTLSKDGRWSAGRVPPGRYAINVRPWTWCQVVDVGPAGTPDVRIVVPPPCDVEVRVLLSDRDEAAPIHTLWWGMRQGSCLEDAASEAPGRFRFRAPLGEIEFDGDDDFEIEERVVELKPGLNRITLRAQRKHGLTIELRDDVTGANLRVDGGFWARITVASDDPGCRSADTSFSNTIRVTKPGRYRVMFSGEIDGFRSIDDHEVDVPAEGTARLVVRLRRK